MTKTYADKGPISSLTLQTVSTAKLKEVSSPKTSAGRKFTVDVNGNSKKVIFHQLFKQSQALVRDANTRGDLKAMKAFIGELKDLETNSQATYAKQGRGYKFKSWWHRLFGGAFFGTHSGRLDGLERKCQKKEIKLLEKLKEQMTGVSKETMMHYYSRESVDLEIGGSIYKVWADEEEGKLHIQSADKKELVISYAESLSFEGVLDGDEQQILNHVIEKALQPESIPSLPDDLERLIAEISTKQDLKSVCKILKSHEDDFKVKDHKLAKLAFQEVMAAFGNEVTYVSPSDLNQHIDKSFSMVLPAELKKMVSVKNTKGVEKDILTASNNTDALSFFNVASQYNAAESASNSKTPPLGGAMQFSEHDDTQGPAAQRTNPVLFELVTAFLTHLGFNMMENALPESIGKTYPTDAVPAQVDGQSSILHGYFLPAGWFGSANTQQQETAKENLKKDADYLKEHAHLFETVCYSTHPEGGTNPINLILNAAPCMSALFYGPDQDRLEYLAARINFASDLEAVFEASQKHPQKNVDLYLTLPGGGAFNNKSQNIAQALSDSLQVFYEKLDADQKKHINVHICLYKQGSNEVTDYLGLKPA